MKEFLEFYKEKCAFKCLKGILGSIGFIMIFSLLIDSGKYFDFFGAVLYGLVLSLPVCVTVFIWEPVSAIIEMIFTPVLAFLTLFHGLLSLFYFCFLPFYYIAKYLGPFMLLCGIVFGLIAWNVYIFAPIFGILTILNIILAIYCSIKKHNEDKQYINEFEQM